jgi:hypothetical protein
MLCVILLLIITISIFAVVVKASPIFISFWLTSNMCTQVAF